MRWLQEAVNRDKTFDDDLPQRWNVSFRFEYDCSRVACPDRYLRAGGRLATQ